MNFRETLHNLVKLALAPLEKESERWRQLEDEWIELALTDGPRAWELAKDPTHYYDNPSAVCCIADKSQMSRFFESSADVLQADGPRNWAPLLYVCFSRINEIGGKQAAFADCAQFLLEHGADPDAHYFDPHYPDSPLSALYGATGVNCNPLLAEVLLRHGANTQDGESIYHAAQLGHIPCLEVLQKHGADFSATQQPWGNTPLYFLYGHRPTDAQWPTALQGIRWLLEVGEADPNVASTIHEEMPLHRAARQHKADAIELLLEHGAHSDAPTRDGLTPYQLAARYGNKDALEVLRRHGAEMPLSDVDQLLAACALGDELHAQGLVQNDPQLMLKLGERDLGLICHHAAEGNLDAVVAMCAVGFPTEAMDDRHASALHQAAWHGHLDIGEALLEYSAPLDVRDGDYQGTPLDWVCHGSLFRKAQAPETYAAFAKMLIKYGSPLPEQDWGSNEVKAVLAAARKKG
jgi:ankyrin repeat protein